MKRYWNLIFCALITLSLFGCAAKETLAPADAAPAAATEAPLNATPAPTAEPPSETPAPTPEPDAEIDLSGDGAVLKAVQKHFESDRTSYLESELASITELTLKGQKLRDLAPLTKLPNLVTLHLEGNRITDVTPLATLARLETLYLNNNSKLKDVEPLNGMESLRNLYLIKTNVNVGDRQALLAKLPLLTIYTHASASAYPERNPKGLLLLGTGKERISEVVECDALTLDGIQNLELKPLVKAVKICMPDVKTIALTNCGLKGAKELSELTGLVSLDLSDNKLETVKPLSFLKNLETLNLSGNPKLTKGDLAYLTTKLSALTITAD